VSGHNKTIALTIDDQLVRVEHGSTILQAAESAGVYIPKLCAHKDLTPYGGCRMCLVEVEGIRGLPTACTTPATEGMVVRTRTAKVQEERLAIFQLILSEHPCSCLVCEEAANCRGSMETVRKVGVSTGCRSCPNDGQCEIQEVAERIGLSEIVYPIYYRGLRVEREDPFYDRDYNLCILCGRCVRVCQEVRAANVLAFKQRGGRTVIGPAFERTHLEAGCEFCGACVEVCPTGTLSEKTRKWTGKPESEVVTTCALCGVGCQLRVLVKNGEVVGTLPAEGSLVSGSQLCVKGRFCVAELVSHPKRLKKPVRTIGGRSVDSSWDEAIAAAAEKLSACPPERFGMVVSANLSNEDLYVAQKFAREAMRSRNIDTGARAFYGPGFAAYVDLLRRSAPLASVREASVVLCVGLDTRFGRSVVGVELRRAMKRGAKIVTLNPHDHNLAILADSWIRPDAPYVVDSLSMLGRFALPPSAHAHAQGAGAPAAQPQAPSARSEISDALSSAARLLRESRSNVILVGSEFIHYEHAAEIFSLVAKIADAAGAGVVPLPVFNNLYGSILMGCYPEILPGGRPSRPAGSGDAAAPGGFPRDALDVLYLIGETPPNLRARPAFVIYQNTHPIDPGYKADLVFPAAEFTEIDGTFVNGEGRIQRVRKAVDPPGEALPDWKILSLVAAKMGIEGFDYENAGDIHKEISGLVDRFDAFDEPDTAHAALRVEAALGAPRHAASKERATRDGSDLSDEFPHVLAESDGEHVYRGISIARWVEGARVIFERGKRDV
jgi:predicted molibdopterin-dependent oxidoreductase YjgC